MSHTLLEKHIFKQLLCMVPIIVSFLGKHRQQIQTNAYVYNTSDNDFYSKEKAEMEEIGNLTSAMVK